MLKTQFPRLGASLRNRVFNAPVSVQRFYSQNASAGLIKELLNLKDMKEFINKENKVSVIDFYAVWCGPCKALEPIFHKLAEKTPEVQFGRVDVDQASDLATEYGVTAMPTCIFFKDGEKVDTIIGANPPKIAKLIKDYSGIDVTTR